MNKIFSFLVFLIGAIFPIGSFALQETIITIDDSSLSKRYKNSKQMMVFDKSEKQKLTVVNYTKADIRLGNIYFIGDEFTVPLVVKDYSIPGYSGCSIVKAGTSCSFAISANSKAVPTLNPDGILLVLNYNILGEMVDKFIQFKVKSTYNDDVRFKYRNIEFKDDQDYLKGELIILNNTYHKQIVIKNIELIKGGEPIGKTHIKNSRLLNKGESCRIELFVDKEYIDEKGDTLPITITYDVIVSGRLQKGLTAVAAGVFLPKLQTHEFQPWLSIFSGYFMAKSIQGVYSDTVSNIIGKLSVGVLGNGGAAKFVTTTSLGLLMGSGYAVDERVNKVIGYKGGGCLNSLVSGTSILAVFGVTFCFKYIESPVIASACVGKTILCGLIASFTTEYIDSILYSNVVRRLPEQGFGWWIHDKSTTVFNSAVMTIIRVSCNIKSGVYFDPKGEPLANLFDGKTELYRETLSGLMIPVTDVGINYLSSLVSDEAFVLSEFLQNSTIISTDNDCDKECVCAYLDEEDSSVEDLY